MGASSEEMARAVRLLALTLVAAGALTGCLLGVDYQKGPPAPAPGGAGGAAGTGGGGEAGAAGAAGAGGAG